MTEDNAPVTLYAYLIKAPALGAQGAGPAQVRSASAQELAQEIRDRANCAGAEVVIVPPHKWNPPRLASTSQEHVSEKLQQIVTSIQQSQSVNNLAQPSDSLESIFVQTRELSQPSWIKLIREWTILKRPESGHVYFVIKVEGEAPKRYAAIGRACDLCGKPRKVTKEFVRYSVGVENGKPAAESIQQHIYHACGVCAGRGIIAFLAGVILIVATVALITKDIWEPVEIAVNGIVIGIAGSILLTARFTRRARVARKAWESRARERYLWDEIKVVTPREYKNLEKRAEE